MGKVKERKDAILAKIGAMKTDKGKQDKLAKVVKALTKAEYDAPPKALQKELKEYR